MGLSEVNLAGWRRNSFKPTEESQQTVDFLLLNLVANCFEMMFQAKHDADYRNPARPVYISTEREAPAQPDRQHIALMCQSSTQ